MNEYINKLVASNQLESLAKDLGVSPTVIVEAVLMSTEAIRKEQIDMKHFETLCALYVCGYQNALKTMEKTMEFVK